MIKSMTGFGRYELTQAERKFCVEIKSVNHRYLDVNIKLPKKLFLFENAIRTELKKYASRGKVDIFISMEDMTEAGMCVKYNHGVAAEYMKALNQMAKDFDMENDTRISMLSRYPEVLTMEEEPVNQDELWSQLQTVFTKAAENFVESRSLEGKNLKLDLIQKLEVMKTHVEFIEEKSPQIVAEYREKLLTKISDLMQDVKVDESRLLMEVTLFADKSCIDEEMVRLKSHILTTLHSLEEGGEVGRKLDFIAQEMNREANTTLSKSNDLEIANRAIFLKTEIEKVREQIQNLE